MRIETTTATVGGILTPDTVVTRTITRAVNGAVISNEYKSEMTILGVDPVRGTTAEERAKGIESLALPITVVVSDPLELVRVAKIAASTSVHFTEGQELTLPKLVYVEYLAARAVKKALRELEEDV